MDKTSLKDTWTKSKGGRSRVGSRDGGDRGSGGEGIGDNCT